MEKSTWSAVRAAVGSKAVSNLSRYITDDLRGIVAALLQNARRAGASKVIVDTKSAPATLVFHDNGRGLSVSDVQTLLTFGSSKNEAIIEHDEAPAGTGLFALAQRGARFASLDWQLELFPSHFRGEHDATALIGTEQIEGFRVTFNDWSTLTYKGLHAAVALIEALAAPMPFETIIDGRPVERSHPIDWIRNSQKNGRRCQVIERTVGDCLILAARFERGGYLWKSRVSENASRPGTRIRVAFDVFGHIIERSDDELADLTPDLASGIEGLLALREDATRWYAAAPVYFVVVSALGSESLKLSLPDGRTLIPTDGLKRIGREINTIVADLIQLAPRNAVGAEHALRKTATELPSSQVVAVPAGRIASGYKDPWTLGLVGDFAPEAKPVIVVDNGLTAYRAAGLPCDEELLQVALPGATIACLIANASGLGRTALFTNAPMKAGRAIACVTSVSLVVDGRRVPLAVNGVFNDTAVAVAWTAHAPIPDHAEVLKLAIEVDLDSGERLTSALPFAIIGCATPAYMPHVLRTPNADIDSLVLDMVAIGHSPRIDDLEDDVSDRDFAEDVRAYLAGASMSATALNGRLARAIREAGNVRNVSCGRDDSGRLTLSTEFIDGTHVSTLI